MSMFQADHDITKWLGDRMVDQWREEFDCNGYITFENILSGEQLSSIKNALLPYLDQNITGRNEFEGHKSNRVYAMLAKSPVFADLVTHPLAMAFVEADLGRECLLSACLAINLHPGETAQPWHFDDSHYQWPRPRPSLGVSAFWAVSDLTDTNGATELLPRSHLWPDDTIDGAVGPDDFDQGVVRDGVLAHAPMLSKRLCLPGR
jgi:ectoine hydroxylase-related dioxygenase (phytanoyl-CoA dioxygenase family)